LICVVHVPRISAYVRHRRARRSSCASRRWHRRGEESMGQFKNAALSAMGPEETAPAALKGS